MKGGMNATMGRASDIDPITKNPSDYDLVIVGTPVWSSNMAPPVFTYLIQYRDQIKNMASFCTCMGGGYDKALEKLAFVSGKKQISTMFLTSKDIENPDENYRRCYVSNLKILAYDACMAIMLGALCLGMSIVYDDLEDEAQKSEDLTDVILADVFGLVYKTFNYAKLDFFWWDSIFSPTIDWNPFMLSSLTNTIEQVTDVATGEKNAFDAMCQMFGFARQNRPIFRYLGDQTELFPEE